MNGSCTNRRKGDGRAVFSHYAGWGQQALHRFLGMFALSLLNRQARTLFLARDFFASSPSTTPQHARASPSPAFSIQSRVPFLPPMRGPSLPLPCAEGRRLERGKK